MEYKEQIGELLQNEGYDLEDTDISFMKLGSGIDSVVYRVGEEANILKCYYSHITREILEEYHAIQTNISRIVSDGGIEMQGCIGKRKIRLEILPLPEDIIFDTEGNAKVGEEEISVFTLPKYIEGISLEKAMLIQHGKIESSFFERLAGLYRVTCNEILREQASEVLDKIGVRSCSGENHILARPNMHFISDDVITVTDIGFSILKFVKNNQHFLR